MVVSLIEESKYCGLKILPTNISISKLKNCVNQCLFCFRHCTNPNINTQYPAQAGDEWMKAYTIKKITDHFDFPSTEVFKGFLHIFIHLAQTLQPTKYHTLVVFPRAHYAPASPPPLPAHQWPGPDMKLLLLVTSLATAAWARSLNRRPEVTDLLLSDISLPSIRNTLQVSVVDIGRTDRLWWAGHIRLLYI